MSDAGDFPDLLRRLRAGDEQAASELIARYERRAHVGQLDLPAFIAQVGPLPLSCLATLAQLDQRLHWQAARPPDAGGSTERVPAANADGTSSPPTAEAYFERFPELARDVELAAGLILNEFYLRDQLGQKPTLSEYQDRFPKLADVLRDQIGLYRALATPIEGTAIGRTAATPGDATPTDTTALGGPASADPGSLPQSFGRYRIVKPLGQGGMGTVYLALDTKLQRQVALKVPRFMTGDPQVVARFLREARVAATFHHPHLCPVYDVGDVAGVHYLTMPLLGGQPLSAWLHSAGRLPEATACRLAMLIARAVHVAHQAGVIHRDLKPSNIMIQEGTAPVVMDFGLARRGGGQDPRLTASGVVVGTGAYMPPEQILPDSTQIGPAADVYSVGVILYEMLTGRTPFQGSFREVLRATLTEPPPRPCRLRPDLHPEVEAICLKALAKEPSARFGSLAAMAAALEPFAQQAGPSVTPSADDKTLIQPRPADAAPAPGKNRRVLWAGIAAVALALLLGGALWHLFSTNGPGKALDEHAAKEGLILPKPEDGERKPPAPFILKGHPAAIRSIVFNPRDANLFAFGSDVGSIRLWDVATRSQRGSNERKGVVLAVAFSPSGKQLAIGGGDEADLEWDVLLWNVDAGRGTAPLSGHSYLVSSVAYSPDGATLASAAGDNTIRLWDVAKREQKGLLDGHTVWVRSVAFSPTDKLLVSGGDDETVRIWDLPTGKAKTLKGHGRPVRAVAFSPDGATVASGGEDRTVKLWDAATGHNLATLEGHTAAVNALAFHPKGTLLVTASADQTLKVWNMTTRKIVFTLEGHASEVHAVAVSPDGRTIASGAADGRILLWDMSALGAER
ncbi:MAG: serine/threonine-protein kinase [Gemmataceae bacterium]